jgi:hypothetical protein
VALGATGVFVETGGGAVVDPQPTKRNGKHTTKAISMLTTITGASGEKRLLDMSFLLIRNNPMSRLSVQAKIASSCHRIHWPKGDPIPRIRHKADNPLSWPKLLIRHGLFRAFRDRLIIDSWSHGILLISGPRKPSLGVFPVPVAGARVLSRNLRKNHFSVDKHSRSLIGQHFSARTGQFRLFS